MTSSVVLEVVGVAILAVLAIWVDDERTARKLGEEEAR